MRRRPRSNNALESSQTQTCAVKSSCCLLQISCILSFIGFLSGPGVYQQMGMFHKSKGNVFNDVSRMKHRGTKNRGRPKTDGDHGGGEYIWQNTQQLKTKGTKAWHCSEKGSCRSWRALAPATTPGCARSWRSLGCRMQMAQLCAVGWCVEATIVQYF